MKISNFASPDLSVLAKLSEKSPSMQSVPRQARHY
uniref:Uncharacterized protein n=1 Tax=Arundo donax TaxID=35708 RepID=A0A0A8ZXT8_ARUDO